MPELERLITDALNRNVSRETLDCLSTHLELLRKWNTTINLVSPSTLAAGAVRHIADSAQLMNCTTGYEHSWLDFGSGGGFPGLVCAIIAKELAPELSFTLVESDKRKSAFLVNAARTVNVNVTVFSKRIEDLPPQGADIISARAVASLSKLLEYAHPHLSGAGKCIFPKGERFKQELGAARQQWNFKLSQKPSITDDNAAILVLGDIARV
ncbi:16S rRNA (guanine(527)-N(7))-methyltransferase RsmG [Aliiruegeria sabulilitoris]|uniref:16S rRNA (guanine(527)-N(7))-methyltransferase RsmG n=1 Tax=Aliiruegeria sabulilitoris TaxID=1510458 RepID=UPI00082957B9|nr:16S rRNA (guanine(527)-N(7))-methyltransferase RsmG [Aliiruegeria sabulilitoris]NDR57530.1 16S rRNA (guanine(527)-N(7))-methyltransferase RsmG [Pseudoruegeria sp. M32A2M]